MFYLAKYNTQTTFTFPVVKRGVVDLATSSDWTPAAADSSISKDQGATADTTNTVTAVTGGGTRSSVLWKLTLTATELSAAEIVVQIVDAATKAIEDQTIIIYTYGNASAKIPFDLSTATQNVNVSSISADAITASAIATDAIGSAELAASAANEIADAILARNVSGGSSTGRTVSQALHALRNKWTISAGTLTVYDTDDSTTSWTSTVTGDATANPLVTSDPA